MRNLAFAAFLASVALVACTPSTEENRPPEQAPPREVAAPIPDGRTSSTPSSSEAPAAMDRTPGSALEPHLTAAREGDAQAQFQLALLYYQGGVVPRDYEQARYWFEKSAAQGHTVAEYNLGVMYNNGEGVPRDPRKAVYWWQKSAANGHAAAQTDLAMRYYKGEGVAQSSETAAMWMKKSAEQGDEMAQYNLGFMYYDGEGVPQDYEQAVYWMKRSKDAGYAPAVEAWDSAEFKGIR